MTSFIKINESLNCNLHLPAILNYPIIWQLGTKVSMSNTKIETWKRLRLLFTLFKESLTAMM